MRYPYCFWFFYCLIGSPCVGAYGKWWRYLRPKRLTLKSNPPIYKWLWWNFTWSDEVQ